MDNCTAIVEAIIQSYPELMRKLQGLKYSVSRSHGKEPTASAAMMELPPEEQRRYNAIRSAIRHTAHAYQDSAKRLLVIRASFWEGSKDDDSLLRTISWLDAQEYRMDFIQAVSQRLELDNCAGCIYRKQLFGSYGFGKLLACNYCYETGRTRAYDDTRCYSKCLTGAQQGVSA